MTRTRWIALIVVLLIALFAVVVASGVFGVVGLWTGRITI